MQLLQSHMARVKGLALIVCLFSLSTTLSWADGKQATVLDPTKPHYGKTYSELAMAWWDWAVNQPPDMNPILDETGAFASVGQDEDYGQGPKIFFLAGTFGGNVVRECTVPQGKTLFIPIFNSLWIVPEECDTGGCRAEANSFIDTASSLYCTINGVPVADIFAYRAQSPPGGSPFHIREGGWLESLAPDFYVPRGYITGSIADGYWLMVDLPQNMKTHTIEFGVTTGDPDNPEFALSVVYHLKVSSAQGGANK